MVARNLVNPQSVVDAAEKVGVDAIVRSVRKQRDGRYAVRFVLRPNRSQRKFIRVGHTGRLVWAVCLHGHYEFMKMLFNLEPSAFVESSMADRVDANNLESIYNSLYHFNIGSVMEPIYYGYACKCGDD